MSHCAAVWRRESKVVFNLLPVADPGLFTVLGELSKERYSTEEPHAEGEMTCWFKAIYSGRAYQNNTEKIPNLM